MTYLLFIVFFNLFFLIGRGLYSLLLQKSYLEPARKIFNIEINLLFPLIGLFAIGNIAFLLNFFTKINQIVIVSTILCLISLNLLNKKINIDKKILIFNFFVPLIIGISSNNINLHYDAGLYHLQFQNWLKSYKIVENLVLAHSRNGYSSIYDYISTYFWWDGNYLFLHFINLVFITSFFSVLIFCLFFQENIFLKYSSLAIIIYSFLDNFGYYGGRNGFIYIESIGKQDVAFAIIFYLVFLFLIYSIKYNLYTNENFFWITVFSLFALQLRISAAFLFPILLFYIYKLLRSKKYISFWKYAILQIILGTSWIAKNLISTGCMFFPVEFTCFDKLNIYGAELANNEKLELYEFHKGYNFNDNFYKWFDNFLDHSINKQVLINFAISFFVIRLFFKIIFIEKRLNNYLLYFIVLATIASNIFILLVSAPGDRFFIQLFLVIIGIAYFITVDEIKIRNIKYFKNLMPIFTIFISVISLLLIPRISDYQKVNNGLQIVEVNSENVKYKKIEGYWGVRPSNSTLCWEKINCIYEIKNINFNESKNSFEIKN